MLKHNSILASINKLKFLNRVIRRSWQVWIFLSLTLVSLLILIFVLDVTPQVEGDFFFSSDDPQFQSDKIISKIFPGQSSQVVISATGDIDSQDYLHRVEVFTETLMLVPGVSSVKSLTHGPKSVEDAFQSPLWRRLVASEDKKSSNFVILLGDVSPKEIIPKLESAMGLASSEAFKLKIAGIPYVIEIIRRNLLHDLKVFSTLAFIIFGAVVILIFRSVRILLGTMISCVDACILTIIITNILGIKTGILTVNLSTIIFVLTLSHIVFITNNWKCIVRDSGKKKGDFAFEAVRYTFTASFWCMATTLLGFLSLLFVPAKPLRELGISGAIGTLVAIIAAYGIYPMFLGSVVPGQQTLKEAGEQKARLFSSPASRRIATGSVVLFVIALAGLGRINTDPSLFSYFQDGTELREGLEYIDRNGGSSPLRLVLRDSAGGRLNNNKIYNRLWELQLALEEDESVGSIISLPVIMAEGNRAPLAFLLGWEGLLKRMEQPKYNQIARSFVTDDRVSGYFFVRMKESGRDASRLDIVKRMKNIITRHGFVPELTGGIYLLQGELSRMVASSLIFGLGGLILLFVLIDIIVSGSARITLAMVFSLCIIPVCMLGLSGYLRIPLDVISAPAANVAIGIGIDAMIHMASFVRRQRKNGISIKESWLQAQYRLCEPIASSALIICAGFGIFSLSSFPPTQRFGFSIIFGTIVSALVAIFVLPVLSQLKEFPGKLPWRPGILLGKG